MKMATRSVKPVDVRKYAEYAEYAGVAKKWGNVVEQGLSIMLERYMGNYICYWLIPKMHNPI
ncbi:hypothetical protein [Xenorhabdus nematophila]|uniref:hypothetical protein n=1 Tax=Xenorhabdus nematophila TaxID=628 RepID=UPI0005700298|nr:hypothetical protein LH67_02685 [Xenorhabdus nematophila]